MNRRHPLRCLRRALPGTALLAALAACATPWNPGPRPAGEGRLTVTITGFASRDGQLLVSVFLGPEGFPDQHELAEQNQKLRIDRDPMVLEFDGVPAGPIAVSVFHDEDADFELDANLLGIPTERWGVSRDARDTFGPPDYPDSYLDLQPGQHLEVPITIR